MRVRLKKGWSMVLALLLCVAAFFTVLPSPVHAAGNTVNFEPGKSIPYGTYSTTRMSIDNGTGIAYCAEPYKKTPLAGQYGYQLLGADSDLRKALYYLKGGPKYDSIKDTYFSGWSDDNIYVIGHLVLSYINDGYSTAEDAFYGAPASYQAKAIEVASAIRGMAAPSTDFKAFIVYGSGGAQTMVGTWFQRYGWIELKKSSADQNVTGGNDSYSLEGAKYGIYSGGSLVETLTTDKNGYAKSGQLKTGSYTVKEISPSKGYQIDSRAYDVTVNADTGSGVSSAETPYTGWVELNKSTADAGITDQNDNYSLEGAAYGIYSGDRLVETLTTNADGYAKSSRLSLGSYVIREMKESKGYKLDVEAHAVSVTAEAGTKANVTEVPQSGWIELQKKTNNANISDGNSNYSLKGAEYGVFMGDRQVATLVTDENGYAKSEAIGIGNYTIRELKASAGYALDTEGHDVTVTDGTTARADVTETPKNYLTDILVQKTDKETGKTKAQGAATLANAEFTVKYYEAVSDTDPAVSGQKAVKTWILKTDEKGQIRFDKEHLVNGDAFYTDTQGRNCLPIGTITIQETKAPTGYFADEECFVHKLAEDGTVETISVVNTSTAPEQVFRGDLEFVKVSDGDLKRMAGVPFTITSRTTGESHTVVTDENGYVSTASSWVKHTANTNAGRTSADGIWFGTSRPDDSKGALIYDTYVIEEQRCEANKGMDLVKVEVNVHRDHVTVQMGTLTDDHIEIATTAQDKESGTHFAKPFGKVTIEDWVSYEGLKKGKEYKLTGTLMDQASGKPMQDAEGKDITAETTFKARKSTGTAKVKFIFDASAMAGKTAVVFEDLYHDGLLLAAHTDLSDEDQTIFFPEIGTTAANDKTGDHTALAEKEVTLTDTVAYKGLAAGKTYTVTGILMDRETGKAITVDGKKVTSEAEFTPEKSEGTVELHFTFDGSALAGKTVVAFESLKYEKTEIAVHADIEDEDQGVHFPEIGTTAVNDKTGTHTAFAEKEAALTDTVSYKNLEVGKTYKVTGTLMDRETGKAITIDGDKVMAETEFTPDKSEGSVELHFTFDGSALAGKTVVAFESVSEEDHEIAVHADIEDEAQSVHFPEIHTSAKDENDGDQTVAADSDAVIVDTVTYSNLVKGETYKVTGTLMDKETGKAVQRDGKDGTAEAEFTAEKADGSVDVTFHFNTADLDGHSLVVFEEMTDVKSGAVIAEHKNIEDKDQTVQVEKKPEQPETPEKPETPKEDTPSNPGNDTPQGTTSTVHSPKTGDTSNVLLWSLIAAGALLGCAGCVGASLRSRKNRK
jgi:hypothetical protein